MVSKEWILFFFLLFFFFSRSCKTRSKFAGTKATSCVKTSSQHFCGCKYLSLQNCLPRFLQLQAYRRLSLQSLSLHVQTCVESCKHGLPLQRQNSAAATPELWQRLPTIPVTCFQGLSSVLGSAVACPHGTAWQASGQVRRTQVPPTPDVKWAVGRHHAS